MGKVIISTQMTLDGVIDPTEWFNPNGQHEAFGHDELLAADALLLGRKTYQGLAGVWPGITDDSGFADRVNGIAKYVASRTLRDPLEWNASVLEGDLVDAVTTLKERVGGNLVAYGCGELAFHLAENGLADEIRLWVHPVVWGSGERPFHGRKVAMQLKAATTFDSGVVLLCYRAAADRQ